MKMRIIALFLALALLLGAPACIAESAAEPSHLDDFLGNLGKTWDSFLNVAGDAGNAVASWAEDAGVTAWVEGAVNDVTAWADESGVSAWAQGALEDISAWADESGLSEWAQNISAEPQALFERNRPAVEAWLAQAGEDVKQAWNTLVNADQHTTEEVKDAYDAVIDSLEETGVQIEP